MIVYRKDCCEYQIGRCVVEQQYCEEFNPADSESPCEGCGEYWCAMCGMCKQAHFLDNKAVEYPVFIITVLY